MSFTFACYFPGDDPLFFTADVDQDQYIVKLLEVIHQELKDLDEDVSVGELSLYKTDIPFKPNETLVQRSLEFIHAHQAEALDEAKIVGEVFSKGSLRNSRLDVLVATPDIILGNLDILAYKKRVKKGLVNSLSKPLRPSTSDVVNNVLKVASFLSSTNLGPVSLDHVPTAMFSPPLAKLKHHIDNLEALDPTGAEIQIAARFLEGAVKRYDTEEDRQRHTKSDINTLVGEPGKWEENSLDCSNLGWEDRIRPTASWWHKDFAVVILALKNTLGINGDAILQAVVDYSKIVSSKKYEKHWGSSNFPALLIGISDTRIQVASAVCTGPIYVSTLYTVDLVTGFYASPKTIELARVFHALSLCRTDLRAYYDNLSPSSSHRDVSAIFPNPTFIDAQPPPLTFTKFMSRIGEPTPSLPNLGNAATVMYFAVLADTGEEVVVKFTSWYNKKAHALLADAGLAPTLHFCELMMGNLYMVVMGRVKGKSIWQLVHEVKHFPAPFVPDQVEKAISLLHDANLVFGDLRDANVIYTHSDGSPGGEVYLIDFDWADEDGKGRYPPTLNTANGWAKGVEPGGVMRKEHDLWQLDRFRTLCKQDSWAGYSTY